MWGRLKRRILRSKAGGGIYSSSQDEGFSETHDTYRDFREELYDESRENPNWKDGKSVNRTKGSFPGGDRCSCGTPGGRELQENVVRSERLRRKNDFILGADGKSCSQPTGNIVAKFRNDYISTSTGPSTRGHVQYEEQGIRASTSTGQIPCISEEQARNERNAQSILGNGSRELDSKMTYADDEVEELIDDDDDEEEAEEEEETDGESEDEDVPFVPPASEPFRVSTQSEGAKSSSNSSDYTSLSFDLNYVKVSPPKLRRRRKQTAEKGAPLMVRREGRLMKPAPGQPSNRAGKFEQADESNRNPGKLDHVAADPSRRSSDDAGLHHNSQEAPKSLGCKQPAATPAFPQPATPAFPQPPLQQHSSGYVSLADVVQSQLPSQLSQTRSDDVRGRATLDEPPGANGEETESRSDASSALGSVLQFTFTVRLDNDVIRGTRREVDKASAGSSLVYGRLDILSQDKTVPVHNCCQEEATLASEMRSLSQSEGSLKSQPQVSHNKDNAEHQTRTERDFQSEDTKPAAANFTQKTTPGAVGTKANDLDSTDAVDGSSSRKDFAAERRRVEEVKSGVELSPKGKPTSNVFSSTAKRTAFASGVGGGGGGCRRTLEEVPSSSSQRTTLTTVAIVHRSASDLDAGKATNEMDQWRTASTVKDDASNKNGTELPAASDATPSSPVTNNPNPDQELTHMTWEEVMQEAESLGIPLTLPAQGVCRSSANCLPVNSSCQQKQPDTYWVCSSCTEAMHGQISSARKHSSSKTSSPFKEKFKLQSIFGGRKTKPERGCRAQGVMTSSPISSEMIQSPSPKYKTMPTTKTGAATGHDSPECGQRCHCTVSRSLRKTGRVRSVSPAASSSSKVISRCAGETRGQQRISHFCSPPLLRWRFSHGSNNKPIAPSSAHLSSEMLSSSSSPVIRRPNDIDRHFLKSLAQLMGCSWYWGSLSFEAAEAELFDRPDGSFLVRDSSDDRYILSVSFRSQRSAHHVRIERHEGMFSFSSEHGLHEAADIVEFIKKAVELSQAGQCLYYLRPRSLCSAPVPVQLLYPVSRFSH